MPRIATVRLKTIDRMDQSAIVYLETEDGIARVVVPTMTDWYRIELNAQVEVPQGNLEHPEVAAGIRWTSD